MSLNQSISIPWLSSDTFDVLFLVDYETRRVKRGWGADYELTRYDPQYGHSYLEQLSSGIILNV